MDPVTASLAIIGIGVGIFGTIGGISTGKKEAEIASQEYQVGGDIAQLQIQENQFRRQAMELNASRSSTQALRQTQQASAMALAAGVGKGAQFSSSAQSGQQQATAEGAYSQEGISRNLQIGENIFDTTSQIDMKKILLSQLQSQQASLQGQAAVDQGIASIGFGLAGSSGQLGQIGGYLGGLYGGGAGSTQGPGMPQMGYLYNQ